MTNKKANITLLSELTATAFLLIAVVGSGIAAERLSGGNIALALFVNAVVTGCALFPLILVFAPISGAHMNPVVTFSAAALGHIPWPQVPLRILAQIAGALCGVWIAHAMFDLPLLQVSVHERAGPGQWLAEIVATSGLLGVVIRCERYGTPLTAAAVATYITGAYWFTASTSFANPAVTVARGFTDTFSGIQPHDILGFVLSQMAALLIVVAITKASAPRIEETVK